VCVPRMAESGIGAGIRPSPASMRPRHGRLGCSASRSGFPGQRQRFNEAEDARLGCSVTNNLAFGTGHVLQ
jgi:hypothetical protein